MSWKTALAVYLLFWVISAFLVLPFEARASDDGEMVAGQDRGAPSRFRPGRVAIRTTILSGALFALFYANYRSGWVTIDTLGLSRG